jgi:hypothetical protein
MNKFFSYNKKRLLGWRKCWLFASATRPKQRGFALLPLIIIIFAAIFLSACAAPFSPYQPDNNTAYIPQNTTENIPEYSSRPEPVCQLPTATPVNITIPAGQNISPEEMIADVTYTFPIASVRFVNEPDIFQCGEHILEIEITDTAGNVSITQSVLTVLPNEIPPEITGVENLTFRRFGTLLLRQNVAARDAFGHPLEFSVDSAAVDADTPGEYQIIYFAYDRWGNRAEVSAYVTITDVDIEWVYRRVDEILEGLTSPDASQTEQARAVHTWMTRNMTYAAAIGLATGYENVYQGLRHRSGNCFVYYYTTEIMLTRLGIPNKRIDRVCDISNHRWHLINPDGLGWHHMDTSPHHLAVAGQFSTFMFTSSQAEEITRLILQTIGRDNYY